MLGGGGTERLRRFYRGVSGQALITLFKSGLNKEAGNC